MSSQIEETQSWVVESIGGTSNNGESHEREHAVRPPPELPERDEFLEAALAIVSAPSSRTSALTGAGVIAAVPQVSPPQKITIHLVRHAEGPHNLRSIPEKERIAMLDPGLTPYGITQSELLSQRFHAMDKITHILSSPLRRTILTALVGFKPAIDRGIQVLLVPDLRECGRGPCNTGSNIPDLLEEMFKNEVDVRKDSIDASLCYPDWEHDIESWDQTDLRLQRAGRMQAMLHNLGKMAATESSHDVEIVVVTHSRFIMALEGTTNTNDAYYNAEYKSFWIVEDEDVAPGAEKFRLVEREESKKHVHTFPQDGDE